jgi:hypothetical protein
MPQAIRVIDHVAEMADWNQASFTIDGMLVKWNAVTGKFEGITGGGGSASTTTVSGLNTGALTSGLFCYISANSTVSLTDSLTLPTSIFFGAITGTPGTVIVQGVVMNANFTTIGGSPAPGSRAYIAASTDEAGAAGKLTATVPVSGIVAEVAIVIDNSSYAGSKQCLVLIQVKTPVVL